MHDSDAAHKRFWLSHAWAGGSRARRAVLSLLVALGLHGLGLPVSGTPGEALTLEQALELAREENPELQAVRQELQLARGQLTTAEFLNRFNPTVRGRGFDRDFAEGGSGDQFQVFLSQEVEIAGQRGLRIEAAERNLERVQAVVADRERLLAGEVKRVFYLALYRRERLRILGTIETFNRRVRDAARQRFRAGASPVMEANLADIRLGQARKDTLTAEAEYEAALLDLRRALGAERDREVEPVGELRGRPQPVELAALLDEGRARRPDLLATSRDVQRVEAELALSRRSVIPNPTFQGIYQTERERAGVAPDTIVGGGISIPLPIFDRNQGDLLALGGRQRQARFRVTAVEQRIDQEVSSAFRSYQAAGRAVQVFQEDVLDKVDENLRFIEIAYREGKIGLLQFIVVQDDLIRAQLSYVDSLFDLRVAEADLEQAVGSEL